MSNPLKEDYLLENTSQRLRLQALVDQLSDEELGYPLENGWTVAATLAHLAFWDQQRWALLTKWQDTGVEAIPLDNDAVNEAVWLLADALPPRTAARLAVTAAETVDGILPQVPPDLAQAIVDSGYARVLHRALHRGEHLDQIEAALRKNSGRK